jgi:hypothetical protein
VITVDFQVKATVQVTAQQAAKAGTRKRHQLLRYLPTVRTAKLSLILVGNCLVKAVNILDKFLNSNKSISTKSAQKKGVTG